MFAIYDIQGRRLRSSLEQLEKVRAPQASGGPALRPDHERRAELDLAEQSGDGVPAAAPVSFRSKQAYREMLNLTEREAILHAHQLMSHPVVTAQASQDILSAWEKLRDKQYQQLPVLDELRVPKTHGWRNNAHVDTLGPRHPRRKRSQRRPDP